MIVQAPAHALVDFYDIESQYSSDEILIREGLATAWTRDGQHRDLLVELELLAKRSDTGCLW